MTDARFERVQQLDHPRCPTDPAFRRGLIPPQKAAFASLTGGGLKEAAEKASVGEKTVARWRARPAWRIALYPAAAGSRPPD